MAAVTEAFPVLIARHVVPDEQQKLDGNELGHWLRAACPPQTDAERLACCKLISRRSNPAGTHSVLAELVVVKMASAQRRRSVEDITKVQYRGASRGSGRAAQEKGI